MNYYTSLDSAFNDTYLSKRYDMEHTRNHSPPNTYQQVIDNLNNLKANGKVPINEQIGKLPYQEKYGCLGVFAHMESCRSCSMKFKNIINQHLQLQNGEKIKKIKYPLLKFDKNTILIILLAFLGITIISQTFDFSISMKKK